MQVSVIWVNGGHVYGLKQLVSITDSPLQQHADLSVCCPQVSVPHRWDEWTVCQAVND